jgi:hypothetical protein
VVALKRWDAYVAFGAPARRRLTKMILLLGLGYALHFPFFSLNKLLHDTRPQEYAMMFQVDILHCLAISILLLMVFIVIARTPRRFLTLTAGSAAVIVPAAPLVWLGDLSEVVTPFLAPYFNENVPSIFPLFPFAAYLFTGAALGVTYIQQRNRGMEQVLLQNIFRVGLAVSAVGLILELQPVVLYPSHDFWKTSPNFFLIRIGVIAAVTSSIFRLRALPPVGGLAGAARQSSLIVYAVHLVLVYGSAANPVSHRSLAIHSAPVRSPLPSVSSWSCDAGVHRGILREHHYPLRIFQANTSTVLYFFLTKPY